MHEDEWGHFIDLEMNQTQTHSQTQKKTQHQPRKTQETKASKNFTVIYEEDIWYKRDETNDSDYYIKEGLSEVVIYYEELKKEEPRKKELKKETVEYFNKIATILYCITCASFISCSLFLI
jgi:hypothetical protein